MLVIAVALRSLTLRQHRQQTRHIVIAGAIAVSVCLMLVVPWSLYARSLGHPISAPGTDLLRSQGKLAIQRSCAVIIEELYGQRTFNDSHRAETLGDTDGRYGHFVSQTYRLADTSWAVFSMATLTRTPEFRQATA